MTSAGVYQAFFLASMGAFMYTYKPHQGYPEETPRAAAFKVTPILALLLMLYNTGVVPGTAATRRWTIVGLLFSMCGDVCLVWRLKLFIPGLLFFGIAQVMYVVAFGSRHSRLSTALLCTVIAASIDFYMLPSIRQPVMKGLVVLYTILIFSMIWRAMDRYLSRPDRWGFVGLVGAAVFAVSDFTIAVDKWVAPVPASCAIVMVTYYTAQFLIASSVHRQCTEAATERSEK